ncbi:hypothetical protein ACKVMT_07275 [Halobacteriales archaeon Cl-PHB]
MSEPYLLARHVNKIYHRWQGPAPDAVEFFEEDWDNLLLLDACRYDTFAERADLPGDLDRRTTRCSSTPDFLEEYIDGTDLKDTVYVTANPQLYRKGDDMDVSFHDVVHVWDGGWDDEYKTVRPEALAEATREAEAQYPNKRLLVHFIQPHYPFIGPTGQEHFDLTTLHFWNRVNAGEVDTDAATLRQAYRENLDVVLPVVEDLLTDLGGLTVVSADHGQMFGERSFPIPRREFGHPMEHYTPELVTVPWHTYQNGQRRTVTAGESTSEAADETDGRGNIEPDADVQDRLEQLGYT